jgi:hypothetical protein
MCDQPTNTEITMKNINPLRRTHLDDYLHRIEKTDCPGLITNAKEWVLEGWGIQDKEPTPEQLAAAMFMEANTQDSCVASGESVPEYPKQLRAIAHQILRLAGHGDPMILDLCNANIEVSNAYERGGNMRASTELRRVGNMLGAMYHGHTTTTIYPKPKGVNDGMVDATYVVVLEGSQEVRLHCKFDPITMLVGMIEKSLIASGKIADEFVEISDGRVLRESDGVVFDR